MRRAMAERNLPLFFRLYSSLSHIEKAAAFRAMLALREGGVPDLFKGMGKKGSLPLSLLTSIVGYEEGEKEGKEAGGREGKTGKGEKEGEEEEWERIDEKREEERDHAGAPTSSPLLSYLSRRGLNVVGDAVPASCLPPTFTIPAHTLLDVRLPHTDDVADLALSSTTWLKHYPNGVLAELNVEDISSKAERREEEEKKEKEGRGE
eukprot:CAMPEP_0113887624 /NCGR_PEP_ID=MMETSP0780_2-20120614/12327_1 /TAXON_ID=652834 /ORGANISM="Palpitomonas bilix" /LENGTH=205 /DNA_ID=CAMNT_0000876197 /DNA_START=63 /DNA_END=677 /DNA_ORIENTATION=+ /assembly_acc=CAM_ASM_000599